MEGFGHAQVADHCVVCNLACIFSGHTIRNDLLQQRRIVLFFGRELVGINVLEDFLEGAVDELSLFCDLSLEAIGISLKALERLVVVRLGATISLSELKLDRGVMSVAIGIDSLKHGRTIFVIAREQIKWLILLQVYECIFERPNLKAICL